MKGILITVFNNGLTPTYIETTDLEITSETPLALVDAAYNCLKRDGHTWQGAEANILDEANKQLYDDLCGHFVRYNDKGDPLETKKIPFSPITEYIAHCGRVTFYFIYPYERKE